MLLPPRPPSTASKAAEHCDSDPDSPSFSTFATPAWLGTGTSGRGVTSRPSTSTVGTPPVCSASCAAAPDRREEAPTPPLFDVIFDVPESRTLLWRTELRGLAPPPRTDCGARLLMVTEEGKSLWLEGARGEREPTASRLCWACFSFSGCGGAHLTAHVRNVLTAFPHLSESAAHASFHTRSLSPNRQAGASLAQDVMEPRHGRTCTTRTDAHT